MQGNLTLTEIELSDAHDRGVTVTEIASMNRPIVASPETTAAFVGRALRGPLNTPILIQNVGEFNRRFGGDWRASCLGASVRQFFDHGGKRLVVVRVANRARGAMLCLPAEGSALVMRTVDPGSTERVRAAVDYDGIDPSNDAQFNLTLQRLDPMSGLIADQEIHTGLSYRAADESCVADALKDSSIARVESPLPTHRPEATTDRDSRFALKWIEAAEAGSNGDALTDYDLIGSEARSTGLFALREGEHIDVLYLPPPDAGKDLGPAAVLAADQYCRRHGAMLIVDPSSAWQHADDAIDGVRELGYASPNIIGYFPPMQAAAKRATTPATAGGAIAGLLCKLDRSFGPWHDLDSDRLGIRRSLQPVVELDDADAAALTRAGMNVIRPGPAGRSRVTGGTTLSRGSQQQRVFTSLAVRRSCLCIVNSIDLATRGAVFDRPDEALTRRIRARLVAYLDELYELGAFENDRFVVECDAGPGVRGDALEHGITIVLVMHPAGSPEPVSFTLHQTAAGLRVTGTAFAPAGEYCA